LAFEDSKNLSDLEVTVYLEFLKQQGILSDYELNAKGTHATIAGRSHFDRYQHTVRLKGVVRDAKLLKQIQDDPSLINKIPSRTYPRAYVEKLVTTRDSITGIITCLCGIPPEDTPQIALILEILRTLKGVDLEINQDRITDFLREYGFLTRYKFNLPGRMNNLNARVPIHYSSTDASASFFSDSVLCLAQIHATLYIPIENIPTALEQFKDQPLLREIIATRLEQGVE
jgi:hypothetical protein